MSRIAPDFVVIGAAPFDAERLGDGDLHVIDMRVVPQRLEQGVGEAQRHQVLHRLLAEIMVDAENAASRGRPSRSASLIAAALAPSLPIGFSTMMRERGVTRPLGAEPLGDRAEQLGAGRHVKGAHALVGAEQRLQVVPAVIAGDVDRDIVDAIEETLDQRRRGVVGAAELRQRVLAPPREKRRVRDGGARRR